MQMHDVWVPLMHRSRQQSLAETACMMLLAALCHTKLPHMSSSSAAYYYRCIWMPMPCCAQAPPAWCATEPLRVTGRVAPAVGRA